MKQLISRAKTQIKVGPIPESIHTTNVLCNYQQSSPVPYHLFHFLLTIYPVASTRNLEVILDSFLTLPLQHQLMNKYYCFCNLTISPICLLFPSHWNHLSSSLIFSHLFE